MSHVYYIIKKFEEEIKSIPKIKKSHLEKINNYIPKEKITFRSSSISVENFVNLLDNFTYLNFKKNKSKSECVEFSKLSHNLACFYDRIGLYNMAISFYNIGCKNGNCSSFFALTMIYCQIEYYELFKFYFETVNNILIFMENHFKNDFYKNDYNLLIRTVRDIENKNLEKNALLLDFN